MLEAGAYSQLSGAMAGIPVRPSSGLGWPEGVASERRLLTGAATLARWNEPVDGQPTAPSKCLPTGHYDSASSY